jgi:hypothetical protein
MRNSSKFYVTFLKEFWSLKLISCSQSSIDLLLFLKICKNSFLILISRMKSQSIWPINPWTCSYTGKVNELKDLQKQISRRRYSKYTSSEITKNLKINLIRTSIVTMKNFKWVRRSFIALRTLFYLIKERIDWCILRLSKRGLVKSQRTILSQSKNAKMIHQPNLRHSLRLWSKLNSRKSSSNKMKTFWLRSGTLIKLYKVSMIKLR